MTHQKLYSWISSLNPLLARVPGSTSFGVAQASMYLEREFAWRTLQGIEKKPSVDFYLANVMLAEVDSLSKVGQADDSLELFVEP